MSYYKQCGIFSVANAQDMVRDNLLLVGLNITTSCNYNKHTSFTIIIKIYNGMGRSRIWELWQVQKAKSLKF